MEGNQRIPFVAPVALILDGRSVRCQSQDISCEGLGVASASTLRVGAHCEIGTVVGTAQGMPEETALDLTGVVKWCRSAHKAGVGKYYEVGLMFHNMDEDQWTALQACLLAMSDLEARQKRREERMLKKAAQK